jgi:hypothetical protein
MPVQLKNRSSNPAANWIALTGPIINGEGLGAAVVAAGFAAAASPSRMPAARLAQLENVDSIDRKKRSDAVGAAMQSAFTRHSPDSRSLGAIVCLIEARRNEIRSQPTRGQPNGETLGLVAPEPAAFP